MTEKTKTAPAADRLVQIMAKLRDPDGGCPWDLEQNFASIAPYTIEEAYEVADAIQRDDLGQLKDELGDLLLQVVFHSRMAEERGLFDFAAVADGIADKMVRRHPHVFGDVDIATSQAQTLAWEDQKAEERARRAHAEHRELSALDGVALNLPALLRAQKLQARAARVGFDWPDAAPVYAKVDEEIAEVRAAAAGGDTAALTDEIGDLLFSVVNLARHLNVDPEGALRAGNAKFERRFHRLEALAAERGVNLRTADLAALDALWETAKAEE
ncbi:MAG: nucleoside triphosphate pyrophosphohydrolase [Alphaproteobacteria bacterium]